MYRKYYFSFVSFSCPNKCRAKRIYVITWIKQNYFAYSCAVMYTIQIQMHQIFIFVYRMVVSQEVFAQQMVMSSLKKTVCNVKMPMTKQLS